ncbi:hypothetical protein DENSPDRAFT_165230 [Dentipellis sp. KUC8613]|nr:hypothetical protein DENSPDRAFT_165230 [Dentipellis sp. KUC8613]
MLPARGPLIITAPAAEIRRHILTVFLLLTRLSLELRLKTVWNMRSMLWSDRWCQDRRCILDFSGPSHDGSQKVV